MISWFARNGVAANLLMGLMIVGGFVSLMQLRVQMFPDFELDTITINVPYPGSTPSETEEGICMRIEEAIQDLAGIKKMTSSAFEGAGFVAVEVQRGYDVQRLMNEIKSRVDSISSFPAEAERPIVEQLTIMQDVIQITISGPTDTRTLKRLAEKVRDGLLATPEISQVSIGGLPDYEISIEISEANLRRYGLTFTEITNAVRASSLDLPAGILRTPSGEILLRTRGQAYTGDAFSELVLRTHPDGTRLTLGDVAHIRDGFEENVVHSVYNNQPATNLTVSATRNQNVIQVADVAKAYVRDIAPQLPEGIQIVAWGDLSYYLKGRLNMLLSNGAVGLVLVFLTLTLFLRPSLAVFVAIGIPISFLGTFIFMGSLDLSINIVSLFGFIMVLGIVVDDAIVVGESVFTEFQRKGPGVESSIRGSEAVAIPVTFAVLTTAVAFVPILFLPGFQGKIFEPIPYVVVASLLFSLVQSKLVLPYHLTLCKVGKHPRDSLNALQKLQRKISDGLERFVAKVYTPLLGRVLHFRYLTLSVFFAIFIFTVALIASGWIQFVFVPGVPSDYIRTKLTMVEGTPSEQTERALKQVIAGLEKTIADLEAEGIYQPIEQWMYVQGSQPFGGEPGGPRKTSSGTHLGDIILEMKKSESREISAPDFAILWRKNIETLPGVKELSFTARAAGGAGEAIDIQITGLNFEAMSAVAQALREKLSTFEGVYDIRDTHSGGKREVQLQIQPTGEILGLTQADLARQVRQAFYGEEAQRIQRGRDEIKVMVRYPEAQRRSLGDLDQLRIRTIEGQEIPLEEVAHANIQRSSSTIQRIDRMRSINVLADVNKDTVDLAAIREELIETVIPQLIQEYPGVQCSFEGEAREQAESMRSLAFGALGVLFVIYALMAVPFKSYLQPLIVMSVIPFGLIGAVAGHVAFGHDFSFISILGCLALAGVLVNDSLVMVDYVNQQVRSGTSQMDAVWKAGAARFRAITLTSMTTFVGLVPILLERSLQAQFLIPMAISLAFGVLFGTLITLFLVPSVYLILEDIKGLLKSA